MSFGPDVPVVVAASAPWDTPTPVNAHQIARRLARRGHRVLFVESTGLRTPKAGARQDRRRVLRRLAGFVRGVREVEPGLAVLAPLALPGAGPARLRRLSLRLLEHQVAWAARRLGMEAPVVWAFLPTGLGLGDALGARLLLYHCVDHYAANPGVDPAWVDALEARMLARADLVLAASPVLAERLHARRPDAECWPNVADVTLFARAVHEALPEPSELAGLARPRAVFVGNLAAYRIDPALLEAAARAVAPGPVLLVGAWGLGDAADADPALGALRERPSLVFLGPRPPEALPALLRHADVGLVPFLDNDHTRGSLPLKLWEYLAAGLPVVARALPNLLPLAREGLVRTASDPDAFEAAVREALHEPPSARAARSQRAAAHGWEARMEALAARVGEALGSRKPAHFQGESRRL